MLAGVALASCSSTGGPALDTASFAPTAAASAGQADDALPADAVALAEPVAEEPTKAEQAAASEETGTVETAAAKPDAAIADEQVAASDGAGTAQATASETAAAPTPKPEEQAAPQIAAADAPEPVGEAAPTGSVQPQPTQFASAAPTVATVEPPVKKRGFLSSFFGTTPAAAAPSPIVEAAAVAKAEPAEEAEAPRILPVAAEPSRESRKIVNLVSSNQSEVKVAALGGSVLPGVRTDSLFEITRKNGLDDTSDVDLHEGDAGTITVAYAAGLARLAPNGLLKQRESVDTACLKPALVKVLKQVEQRFGKRLVVTSGYRSPAYNRKVSGARNSMHMYCAAADVQLPGVSKWELARFVRSMPGRGGVGTYCHTESVHIDVGPERDWNWRCRRRKA